MGWSGETGESGDSGKSCESGKSGTSGQTDMSVGIIIHQISGQISKSLRSRSVSVTNITSCAAEVNISPKISISAQPLKMTLHKNPAMHGS